MKFIMCLLAAAVAAAFTLKCFSCNGTGWKGNIPCIVCGGDGRL